MTLLRQRLPAQMLMFALVLTVTVMPERSLAMRGISYPPAERRYYSPDSSGCFVARFERGLAKGVREGSTGTALREASSGGWDTVWTGVDLGGWGPGSAVVSANSRYVVTFGGWDPDFECGSGIGDNVVIIYGREGRVIRQLALTDFCPHVEIDPNPDRIDRHMMEDQSPYYWGSGHRIEEATGQLVLRVIPDGRLKAIPTDRHIEVRVELATGKVLSPLNRAPIPEMTGHDTVWNRSYIVNLGSRDKAALAACADGGWVVAIENLVGCCYSGTEAKLMRFGPRGDSLWLRSLVGTCALILIPESNPA